MVSPATAPALKATRKVFARFGVSVTFTKTVSTSHDPITGDSVPVTIEVPGRAIRTRGKPRTYERLALIESEAPTLLFRPDTDGQVPPLDSECTWSGRKFVAADVDPIEPDGTAIISRVVVKRGGT